MSSNEVLIAQVSETGSFQSRLVPVCEAFREAILKRDECDVVMNLKGEETLFTVKTSDTDGELGHSVLHAGLLVLDWDPMLIKTVLSWDDDTTLGLYACDFGSYLRSFSGSKDAPDRLAALMFDRIANHPKAPKHALCG